MSRSLLSRLILAGALITTSSFAEQPSLPNGFPYVKNPGSLGAVATRFHLKVDDIARLNGIADPTRFDRAGLVVPLTETTKHLPRYTAWPVAPERRTCGTKVWTFAATKKKGCADAVCAAGPNGGRACQCLGEHGRVSLAVTLAQGASWELELPPSAYRSTQDGVLEIASVDLDADGKDETLLSWIESQSNGIAAISRTLIVLKNGRELLRYDSGEIPATSAAVVVDGKCHLAASHYESVPHPIRRPALYLVERTFDPLRLEADRELIGARFGETQRFVLPFDPLVGHPARGEAGTILTPRRDERGSLLEVSFRSSRARPSSAVALDSIRLGDPRSQRLFPPRLLWDALSGQDALFERDGQEVLWLSN